MHARQSPGSLGEHILQERRGSVSRAQAFYQKQVLDHLNPLMRAFIAEQEMMFVATADARGECDCSFRAGPRGFVRVLDERHLAYPEYRGNGVFASLGNMLENPHLGMIFVDFFHATIGLHVNGKTRILTPEEFLSRQVPQADCALFSDRVAGRNPEMWVEVEVEEAYGHCSKHIPLLARLRKDVDWGTDDLAKRGGDYFHARSCSRPWVNGTTNGVLK
jgi:predicted pyridoxine 5'-phosphate oxidase superfamily flavin-nucleotide-binding protein